jgi:hypothetical protein
MASAAMDRAGNIALAYNTSSATMTPSIYYAARLAGDPPNTMGQGEALILAGPGSQTSSTSRWGDYSNLSVAPDGCTFWGTLEYTTSGLAPWKTRIASFTLPGCTVTGTAPTAPTLTSATSGAGGVALAWTDSTGETGYNVDRCNVSGCTPVTIATVAANIVSYTDATAAPSSSPYTYRIRATNASGSASSNTQTVTVAATNAIGAPTNLKATALKAGGVQLTWFDNATNETRVEVQRTAGSAPATFRVAGSNLTSYTDTTAAARTSYTYQVRACDAGTTCSAWSNTSTVRAR